MIDKDTARDAARENAHARRLGDNPACTMCGETDENVLIMESHHIAGRRNDPDLTVWLCRNDHARVTESLRSGGVPMTQPAHPLEWLVATLGGLAGLFLMLARRLKGWAQWLSLFMVTLDEEAPQWREHSLDLPNPFSLGPVVS